MAMSGAIGRICHAKPATLETNQLIIYRLHQSKRNLICCYHKRPVLSAHIKQGTPISLKKRPVSAQ